ncbi:DNA helicase-2 / ATP-dependent DNA helicase PcrA [Flavobacterium gillisiae]|uniref:DNA 3'-5' helicase II n=1 Tax=Flavobacterium gillisiae TaxID=150146 RepID=A0A1H4FV35_9FLAO|nr:UvrD-helicase domain-containing protein [Flavobacterium gillisiae]SEB01001.1 DNA helicase-2 / ATP-dependent DNA helicase PcrA [Flavobacterium gillisiae]
MSTEVNISPAEKASIECLKKVYHAIDKQKNFLVEAGAGAGKTYTLIKALKYLIEKNADAYLKANKRIACITYTKVARNEIRSRTDNHPAIFADTIHAFAWGAIQDFQKALRERISGLSDNWQSRVDEIGGITNQQVVYNLGYPKITNDEISLHHDDVIKLLTSFLNDEKFKRILTSRYPIILIDEYQDTNRHLADALVANFIETESGPMIGFFGDHWQRIYGTASVGLIQASEAKLELIGKKANFRSDKNIVAALNNMRPQLKQFEYDPESEGDIIVFHANNWIGVRRTDGHSAGDLPAKTAHNYLEWTKNRLNDQGWNISSDNTKILMLTNNVLASEQGYQKVFATFSDTDDFLKKNDHYISFLADVVEVGSVAFVQKKYGEMIEAFKLSTPRIRTHSDKKVWHDDLTALLTLQQAGTIGEVIDLLKTTRKPRLSRKVGEREQRFAEISAIVEEDRIDEDKKFFAKIQAIRSIPYSEIKNVVKYIDNKTLYSTKHGVKGAEFENVIVVLGRGWNHYNWNQLLEWIHGGVPALKQDTFERNRNLFYVACSRPKKRLSLLFTQELSAKAILGLQSLFGNVIIQADLQI